MVQYLMVGCFLLYFLLLGEDLVVLVVLITMVDHVSWRLIVELGKINQVNGKKYAKMIVRNIMFVDTMNSSPVLVGSTC